MSVPEPEAVGEIRFKGAIHVRPFRHGTYLGDAHLESLIERTLRDRYRFGEGWKGFGVVSIVLYDRPPPDEEA